MSEIISSTQNPRVKLAASLQTKAKLRRVERKLVLEGTRLISDALEQGKQPQFVLYDPAKADYELIARLQRSKAQLLQVSPQIINHVSDTQNPQGIAAVFSIPYPNLPDNPQRVLILDAVREPGNMGTVLRTAGASGAEIVLLAPGCVDPYNPKVIRSGMGAHFRLPILEAKWYEIEGYCENLNIYLAAGEGEKRYFDVDWKQAWALVIGNEAHGITDEARNLNATPISIPMANATESLNASIAAAVILFEAQRQRLQS